MKETTPTDEFTQAHGGSAAGGWPEAGQPGQHLPDGAPGSGLSNTPTTASGTGAGAPAKSQQNTVFIHKLYHILEDDALRDLIWWAPNGMSFYIRPNETFSKTLATYFKHTNITSFVRQLNIYGFHKVTNWNDTAAFAAVSNDGRNNSLGALPGGPDMNTHSPSTGVVVKSEPHTKSGPGATSSPVKIWEFKHSANLFRRGDIEGLKFIKRRSSAKSISQMSSRKGSGNSTSGLTPNAIAAAAAAYVPVGILTSGISLAQGSTGPGGGGTHSERNSIPQLKNNAPGGGPSLEGPSTGAGAQVVGSSNEIDVHEHNANYQQKQQHHRMSSNEQLYGMYPQQQQQVNAPVAIRAYRSSESLPNFQPSQQGAPTTYNNDAEISMLELQEHSRLSYWELVERIKATNGDMVALIDLVQKLASIPNKKKDTKEVEKARQSLQKKILKLKADVVKRYQSDAPTYQQVINMANSNFQNPQINQGSQDIMNTPNSQRVPSVSVQNSQPRHSQNMTLPQQAYYNDFISQQHQQQQQQQQQVMTEQQMMGYQQQYGGSPIIFAAPGGNPGINSSNVTAANSTVATMPGGQPSKVAGFPNSFTPPNMGVYNEPQRPMMNPFEMRNFTGDALVTKRNMSVLVDPLTPVLNPNNPNPQLNTHPTQSINTHPTQSINTHPTQSINTATNNIPIAMRPVPVSKDSGRSSVVSISSVIEGRSRTPENLLKESRKRSSASSVSKSPLTDSARGSTSSRTGNSLANINEEKVSDIRGKHRSHSPALNVLMQQSDPGISDRQIITPQNSVSLDKNEKLVGNEEHPPNGSTSGSSKVYMLLNETEEAKAGNRDAENISNGDDQGEQVAKKVKI
ncbi:Sfl1p KNAG_0B04040 [Huiozyma naganishii CBS 8797]|uniref:HSF-type DNA-binding domain-containing protein n=1 Tax=Huiozyma naganishii (strain ATCC MYA-139 / BCRC 22969 / CBS 8797 / KCTC 17520 / NBRC 10181 / NCYC 3082 / Yp74L-3) TaxID=1071383 RepID=J7RVA4_HUIN7|nr:hypothetical protein KNAG_0B04040 [Kazachstania naganishii CBS 8797]CCK68842.1 hypothetical protein KNAG_0B04040 [Kazachstania naganishii CBS 8797]